MTPLWTIISTAIAIIASIMIARKNVLGFYLFMFANIIMIVSEYPNNLIYISVVYLAINFYSVYYWNKPSEELTIKLKR